LIKTKVHSGYSATSHEDLLLEGEEDNGEVEREKKVKCPFLFKLLSIRYRKNSDPRNGVLLD
jgi:hypothetical protein